MKNNNEKHAVAIFLKKTAQRVSSYSCGSASIFGLKQPKEPKNIKSILKKQ